MNVPWRIVGMSVLTLTLIAASPGVALAEPDLVGKYRIVDEDGNVYSAEITKRGASYKVTWGKRGTADFLHGAGVVEGNVLAINWYGDAKEHGVYLFRIMDNGKKLEGKYAYTIGMGQVFKETWTRK